MPRTPKPPLSDDRNTDLSEGDTRRYREGGPSPRLPHEHDESADSQSAEAPSQRDVGGRALEDLERGLVDTDRKPVADRVYDENLRNGGERSVAERGRNEAAGAGKGDGTRGDEASGSSDEAKVSSSDAGGRKPR